jgi:hypothetical protein
MQGFAFSPVSGKLQHWSASREEEEFKQRSFALAAGAKLVFCAPLTHRSAFMA